MRRSGGITLLVIVLLTALLFGLSRVDSRKPIKTMEIDISNAADSH